MLVAEIIVPLHALNAYLDKMGHGQGQIGVMVIANGVTQSVYLKILLEFKTEIFQFLCIIVL